VRAFKVRVATEDNRLSAGETPRPVDPNAANNDPQFAKLDARIAVLNGAEPSDGESPSEIGAAERAAQARTAATAADAGPAEQQALAAAEDAARAARERVLAEMDVFIREARRKENALVADKKARNGERTAAVSELGIKIGEGANPDSIAKTQGAIDDLDANLADLTSQIADAKGYRLDLEAFVAQASAEKTALMKQVDTMQTELTRLDEQVAKNTSNVGEWITRWPVLNALYSGNVRVEQTWLPDMTVNYNFAQAARFDRCITCHRAIATTAPGTATDPLYPTVPDEQRDLTLTMNVPADYEPGEATADEARSQEIQSDFGLAFSDTGIINEADVTVHYVLPESLAARAGLQSGDMVRAIGGEPPYTPAAARAAILRTAHPRLDLFLSDTSPHPLKDVGCTICHDGQGSGTAFQWTSHTPDNARQQDAWAREHGWFDNHHWIFPMRPARFVESNCLKCHHQKGGLASSERFPEPPAPKLVEGWTLVEDFGCFGCHEINGYDSPTVTVGPDLRLEPSYHEVAAQISRDAGLTDDEKATVDRLIEQPTDAAARDELYAAIVRDQKEAADPEAETEARLSEETHRLAAALKPVEIPGRMRKAGPSLRYLDSKADYDWVYSWIRLPSDFRPTTRMPQFFGQYEHLTDDPQGLKDSVRFEAVEIRALTQYLLNESDEFEYIERETGVEAASAERGKWLFQSRGCLACHSHSEFPGIAASQGPDLSRIAAKLNTDKGRNWLYSWLKQPNKYHARTVMPDLYLDPIVEKNAQNQPTGVVTDPAADIAEFLLSVQADWVQPDVPSSGEWGATEQQDLLDLAVLWLQSDTIPSGRARDYLENGIPEEQAAKLKADERLLVNWNGDAYNQNDETRLERQLEFVARRTIGKYGCFGCHDIPGFEDAKPIGTALVDWGRKETSKLAFENIHKFLETHGVDPHQPTSDEVGDITGTSPAPVAESHDVEHGSEGALHAGHLDPGTFSDDDSYFVQAINSHGRDGFLWQKLRHPRSYDYKTTRNKNFNERLRMPRFPLSDDQREAIMTFVLGLVKEPPASKYIYKPDPRQQAIIAGRAILDQFNCAGCHMLRAEQWQVKYDGDTFAAPNAIEDYPFLAPQFTDAQLAASLAKDSRGLMSATIHGEPVTVVETGERTWVDADLGPITPAELAEAEAEEGETIPVFYQFTLWRNTLLNGQAYLRGVDELLVPANREGYGPANGSAYPAWGGDLARYLLPHAIANAKAQGSQANAKEAWGWLPPPLMDQGVKVQTDWLHEFLMDPTAIRPAVVLRMPNFHMSSDEAAKLTDYFAAASGADFPYEYRPQQRASYLAQVSLEDQSGQRLDPLTQAMNIVVDGQYCVKCHAVGEFQPQGDPYTFGPNLADVYRRLRPKFTRDWIANPLRILPYTGMPKNIPYHSSLAGDQDGVNENLYPGNSIQQLTALVDLLMNFDVYAKGKTSVTPLVQKAAAAAQPAAAAAGGQPADAAEPPADADEAAGPTGESEADENNEPQNDDDAAAP
jgi:cytochrome c551/c552